MKDATARGLSADARFVMAYDAARTLSLMVVRAAGYRPRSFGGHYNTFLALEAADGAFAKLSAYFDSCRQKRNASEYDFAGGVTDTRGERIPQDREAVYGRCRGMDKSPSSILKLKDSFDQSVDCRDSPTACPLPASCGIRRTDNRCRAGRPRLRGGTAR